MTSPHPDPHGTTMAGLARQYADDKIGADEYRRRARDLDESAAAEIIIKSVTPSAARAIKGVRGYV